MKPLIIAWGTIAVLIIGVRIGHHFGHKDRCMNLMIL